MTPDSRAQLSLLLEAVATPTPGAVDRRRDHVDLGLAHMIAGAIGAGGGLSAAAAGEPVGAAFDRAVAGMAEAQSAGNTQFGALLLLVPLVGAAGADDLTPPGVARVVDDTTVADAVAFCRSFAHVDVALGEPPDDLADVDVRDPESAAAAAERRGLTLAELMAHSAAVDGVAREWSTGFERTFEAADSILARQGPVSDRAAAVFLDLLAAAPDTHVATRHGDETAERVCERARAVRDGEASPADLADSLVAEGINPGTTADVLAAALFVALQRGLVV